MAGKELIIDDEYCNKLGVYFENQGQHLNEMVAEYISILQSIKDSAIKSGDVSKALGTYIKYAKRLDKQIGDVSNTAKKQVSNFLSQIDKTDQYIF